MSEICLMSIELDKSLYEMKIHERSSLFTSWTWLELLKCYNQYSNMIRFFVYIYTKTKTTIVN